VSSTRLAAIGLLAVGLGGCALVDGLRGNDCDPRLLGVRDLTGFSKDVRLAGGLAVVANGTNGLQLIDFSNPSNPLPVGQLDTSASNSVAIDVVGDTVYIAESDNGLQIADISDPEQPMSIGYVDTGGNPLGVAVDSQRDRAYLAAVNTGVTVVDISDPTMPTVIDSFDTAVGALDVALDPSRDRLYIADGGGGLRVWDATNRDAPFELGFVAEGMDLAQRLFVDGETVYVAGGLSGVHIIDVSVPGDPTQLAVLGNPASAHDVLVRDGIAYIPSNVQGLIVADVSDPGSPRQIGQLRVADEGEGGIAQAVQVTDAGVAVMVDVFLGVLIFDVTKTATCVQ